MNVTGAIDVTEASQVAEGRRLALWLASNLDFPEDRAGRAALVASDEEGDLGGARELAEAILGQPLGE